MSDTIDIRSVDVVAVPADADALVTGQRLNDNISYLASGVRDFHPVVPRVADHRENEDVWDNEGAPMPTDNLAHTDDASVNIT